MKKVRCRVILLVVLVCSITINIFSQTLEEEIDLSIDISPHIALRVGENINIDIEEPWSGGELREAKSQLILQTNTDVELSWECTEIRDSKTGHVLPLGIPEKESHISASGGIVESFGKQPFGLTTFLVEQETREKVQNPELMLQSDTKQALRSSQKYNYSAGVHEFDVIVKYFWSLDGNWSQIRAGQYSGQIIYTVSAVESLE